MTITVVIVHGVMAVVAVVASIATLGIFLLFVMAWMIAGPIGLLAPGSRPWVPTRHFNPIFAGIAVSLYLSLLATIVAEGWRRFDTLSGRMPGDGIEPPAPVAIPAQEKEPALV